VFFAVCLFVQAWFEMLKPRRRKVYLHSLRKLIERYRSGWAGGMFGLNAPDGILSHMERFADGLEKLPRQD
jgi:hypothetical protein